ncbi:MAG: class I SAM-dependent methyltransferase [Cycloclasticus sp.]
MRCPLCESNKINIIELIGRESLINLVKKLTDEDVSYLFDSDLNYCACNRCKLKFFNPLIVGDEKFYNSLQKLDWYYVDEKAEYLEASKYITKTDRVLEVGGGKGAFVKFLQTKHYVGLDSSTKAKEMALKDGVTIENELVQDYATKNLNKFDVVVSFQVLEHVSNPQSFIQAKVDALKVGGRLIIAVPSEDSFLKYATNNILNMPPHHVTRWPSETLYYIAEKYNLQVLDIHYEKLQRIHKLWFVKLLINNSIMDSKLLSRSLIRKFTSVLSLILARILVKGLKDEMLPNGHTVIAIYQKK